jgi:hypothetical protein
MKRILLSLFLLVPALLSCTAQHPQLTRSESLALTSKFNNAVAANKLAKF